uniref:Uncharacterized protein n=1 Tax=Romanomermis culicivorax TaxID=13658 RepID=A0A915HN99_ROMCU
MIRKRRMVVIPGTCKILRSDKSLPPWRGRCGGFKYCMFDYTEEDGRVVHDRIKHDTCWEKGNNAACNVTQVVYKQVRCLFDQGSFRLDGTHAIACLDTKEP